MLEYNRKGQCDEGNSHCDGLAKLSLQLGRKVLLYKELDGYTIAVLEHRLTAIKYI